MMNSPAGSGCSVKPKECHRWGWLNVGGIRGNMEEVVQFMDEHNFSFLVLGETWLKPDDILRHPSIVFELRGQSSNPSRGRGVHGLMVVRNAKLTSVKDFMEIYKDEDNRSCIWFRYKGTLFGGYYLPPSMELSTCIESLMMASIIRKGIGHDEPMYLMGDLNARMGHLTGDTLVNFRSNIRYTLSDQGLSWVKPDIGKWTFETHRGRSIVDYIMTNAVGRKQVICSKVWMNDMVAGSDHRVISCDMEYSIVPRLADWTQPTSRSQTECVIRKIGREYLTSKSTCRAVNREFRVGCFEARSAVEGLLRPIINSEGTINKGECQTLIDEAFSIVMEYVKGSLERAGVKEHTSRRASSKPFWDQGLSLLKKQRDELWMMAKNQEWQSAEMVRIVQQAKVVDKQLKREVRRRKRSGFLNFVDDVNRLPNKDILRLMSSMRRRRQDDMHVPAPGLSPDKMSTYVGYFETEFKSSIATEVNAKDRVRIFNNGLVMMDELKRAVDRMPSNKSPGADGVTAEVLRIGGGALLSVMTPLYESVMRSCTVPRRWNVAVLQLIWKKKGNRERIESYRPISLTSIFRKVLESILLQEFKASLKELDIARGGFIRGMSTYNLGLP